MNMKYRYVYVSSLCVKTSSSVSKRHEKVLPGVIRASV